MNNTDKYKGVLPAFYACYDEEGNISPQRTQDFTKYLIDKGVKGLYVCGSSGECIYQNVAERKLALENVMAVAKGKITVIAHVACNNTKDSVELAAHAQSLGVDAIAAIPPIYFHLPEYAIAEYWNTISAAAPDTDFIIYNIPQLAGVALTVNLLKEMRKNPRVIAVKNSSMAILDIQQFKAHGGKDFIVFNGPDEQFVGGRAIGADGGIGGTYAVMPELFIMMDKCIAKGDIDTARAIQCDVNEVIMAMLSCHGNMYAAVKEILRIQGIDIGDVRRPLTSLAAEDMPKVRATADLIASAINKYN